MNGRSAIVAGRIARGTLGAKAGAAGAATGWIGSIACIALPPNSPPPVPPPRGSGLSLAFGRGVRYDRTRFGGRLRGVVLRRELTSKGGHMPMHPALQRTVVAAVGLAALALLPGVSRAAPVSYDESIDGDLPDFGGPLPQPPTLDFDTGANTVTGTMDVNTPDRDSFAFRIPEGLQVVSGGVVMSDAVPDFHSATWQLKTGNVAFQGTLLGPVSPDSPGSASLPVLPLAAGTYQLDWTGSGGAGGSVGAYTFTFNVAPVPEPASLSLLALGAVAC